MFKKKDSKIITLEKTPNQSTIIQPQTSIDNLTQNNTKKSFTVHLSIDDDKENIYQVNDDYDNEEYEDDEDDENNQDINENVDIREDMINQEKGTNINIANKPEFCLNDKQENIIIKAKTFTFKERIICCKKSQIIHHDKERNLDKNSVCHYLLNKGDYIDINKYLIHTFILLQRNKNKGILSKIPFKQKKVQPKLTEITYKSFIQNNFLYFINCFVDNDILFQNQINKKINLYCLTQISIEKE